MAAVIVSDSLIPSRDNTPLDKRSKIASKSLLNTIDKPNEGLLVYIEDEKTTYQVTSLQWDDDNLKYYITEKDITAIGGANVYFSTDGVTPTDINTIWVDGSDSQSIDESTFDRIRTELNKLDNRLSNIEYAFDVKLDSGDTTYYKGSELATIPGVQPENEVKESNIVLSFTYDGNEFTFAENKNDGEDIRNLGTRFELKLENSVVGSYDWNSSLIYFSSDYTKCSVSSMNHLKFDEFVFYKDNDIVYKAELSSAGLSSEEPTWANKLQPNVHHICIKRAKTETSLQTYVPQDGELIYSVETNKLYIGNDGRLGVVGGSSTGGSSNVTSSYIDLYGPDGTTIYRVTIDENGNVVAKLKSFYDTPEQVAGADFNLTYLKISMVYAGPEGASATSTNACSHSFIELYNASNAEVSLKNISLCLGTDDWQKTINLSGSIPAKCCYLVRLNPVSNMQNANTTMIIDNYDFDAYALDNTIRLSSAGFKIYLCVGSSIPSVNGVVIQNPFDQINQKPVSNLLGYVDLIGALNISKDNGANAAELKSGKDMQAELKFLTDDYGVFRYKVGDVNQSSVFSGSGDTNNNAADLKLYSVSSNRSPITGLEMWDMSSMKPYCVADGAKDLFFYRHKFSANKPNMPTMSIGEIPSTRRFNWISVNSRTEYLMYRLAGKSEWNYIQSGYCDDVKDTDHPNLTITKQEDGVNFTVHKAAVTALATGTYEWCVGVKDSTYVSDTYHFTVTEGSKNLENGSFRFCQISDQQGWVFGEYEPWNLAWKEIIDNFNNGDSTYFPYDTTKNNGIEFFLNTGDMTQNGNRASEWIDYFNCAPGIQNAAQMNCVGNNDLCPAYAADGSLIGKKINPDTFVYFYNYEMSSDALENEAQKINNAFMKSVYAYDYGCAHFICLNSNNYIEEQKVWFERHMENIKARSLNGGIAPKWIIVYVHDAPFNIVTATPENIDGIANFYMGLEKDYKFKTGLRDTAMNQKDDGADAFTWSRLFEKHGVDLVLSGHKHTYSRSYPLLENAIDPDLSDSSINKYGFSVNPWKPLYYKDDKWYVSNTAQDDFTTDKKGVVYVMSQATGYKLQSNKDVPCEGIPWLASYFKGTISGTTADASSAQKNPTFIIWDVTESQVTMNTYQVMNVTNGGSWDSFNGGQPGVTMLDNIILNNIDTMTITK